MPLPGPIRAHRPAFALRRFKLVMHFTPAPRALAPCRLFLADTVVFIGTEAGDLDEGLRRVDRLRRGWAALGPEPLDGAGTEPGDGAVIGQGDFFLVGRQETVARRLCGTTGRQLLRTVHQGA